MLVMPGMLAALQKTGPTDLVKQKPPLPPKSGSGFPEEVKLRHFGEMSPGFVGHCRGIYDSAEWYDSMLGLLQGS